MGNLAPQIIGSQCSGTDSPILVVEALQRSVAQLGVHWTPAHAYSAEKSLKKQRFLRHMFGDRILMFPDCTQLSQPEAVDIDGVRRLVPPIELLVAGFPCQDVSALVNDSIQLGKCGYLGLLGICGGASVELLWGYLGLFGFCWVASGELLWGLRGGYEVATWVRLLGG
jgi:hypothetical protein